MSELMDLKLSALCLNLSKPMINCHIVIIVFIIVSGKLLHDSYGNIVMIFLTNRIS